MDDREVCRYLIEQFGEIFHEWHTVKARRFFKLSGISERNWRVLMLNMGWADGRKWTFREIADEERELGQPISHVRAYQIVNSTLKRLRKFAREFSNENNAVAPR